jgi:hypothetical protein
MCRLGVRGSKRPVVNAFSQFVLTLFSLSRLFCFDKKSFISECGGVLFFLKDFKSYRQELTKNRAVSNCIFWPS